MHHKKKEQLRDELYRPPPKVDHSKNFRKLWIVIILSVVFIGGEFIGGYISHSISVMSDAFHLLTDLIGFILAYVFIAFSVKQPTHKMSFGYHRTQVLGALGNLFIIWALAMFLIYEATLRIINKIYVEQPTVMLIVAACGLPVNILMYFVLHSGGSHSHGLMSEGCGGHDHQQVEGTSCSEALCEDIECLINNSFEDHCHVKKGQASEIHRHGVKVIVEENKIVGRQLKGKKNVQQKMIDIKEGELNASSKPMRVGKNQLNEEMDQDPTTTNDSHNHSHNHSHDHGHNHESMSMQAAVLHALTDIIQSIGLLISSLLIFFFGSDFGANVTQFNGWHYLDPISTYVFSVIVILSTWPVTKNCYYIIMESTPTGMPMNQLQSDLQSIRGVVSIHNVHAWDLRPGKTILIAHVFSEKGEERNVLRSMTDYCRKKKIYHSTIQVEEEHLMNSDDYILCKHDLY